MSSEHYTLNPERSLNTERFDSLVEECEMGILGHKVFVRLKDIPMYLSHKTRDSIRNRYSHSVEVGLSTEYLMRHLSRQLGDDINLNFFNIARIVGMLHDIGHTAYSHDGEMILDRMIRRLLPVLKPPFVSMPISTTSGVSKNMRSMRYSRRISGSMRLLHCSSVPKS